MGAVNTFWTAWPSEAGWALHAAHEGLKNVVTHPECMRAESAGRAGVPRALPLLQPLPRHAPRKMSSTPTPICSTRGDGDEDHQGDEEGEASALLDDSLQLGGVGHQQCNVQHALSCALLVGIMVHVDGLVPAQRLGCREWGGQARLCNRGL